MKLLGEYLPQIMGGILHQDLALILGELLPPLLLQPRCSKELIETASQFRQVAPLEGNQTHPEGSVYPPSLVDCGIKQAGEFDAGSFHSGRNLYSTPMLAQRIAGFICSTCVSRP